MNFAVLQQYDTPAEVYKRPKNLFVANFIGSPTINFFHGTYQSGRLLLSEFTDGRITLSKEYKSEIDAGLRQEKVVVGIRPEHLRIGDKAGKGSTSLKARIVSHEPLGSKTIVYLHPDANENVILKASMANDFRPKIGELKHLIFQEKNLYLFDEVSTDLVLKF
jgi:multiple sugar transport system ATP-binding protein